MLWTGVWAVATVMAVCGEIYVVAADLHSPLQGTEDLHDRAPPQQDTMTYMMSTTGKLGPLKSSSGLCQLRNQRGRMGS